MGKLKRSKRTEGPQSAPLVAILIVVFAILTGLAIKFMLLPNESPFPGTVDRSEFFGYEAYVDSRIHFVRAGDWDMGNTIRENDAVMWVEVEPENVAVGDIIYYDNPLNPGEALAHRVVAIENSGFKTKGDSSSILDTYTVLPEHLKGMVIGVVYQRP